MNYSLSILILTLLLFQSCTTNRIQKMSNKGQHLTEEDTVTLSQDCDLVNNLIAKGMKKAKDKKGQIRRYRDAYLRNDFLVKVLSKTNCLDGKNVVQIQKQLGVPALSCLDEENCIGLYLEYTFIIDDDEFYSINLYFVDNQMTEIISRGRVKIINLH